MVEVKEGYRITRATRAVRAHVVNLHASVGTHRNLEQSRWGRGRGGREERGEGEGEGERREGRGREGRK